MTLRAGQSLWSDVRVPSRQSGHRADTELSLPGHQHHKGVLPVHSSEEHQSDCIPPAMLFFLTEFN